MPLPALTDDLIDEVLLRFPPQEPERLVRATLVCRRWFRLISGPSFRRRFREHHRAAPMLGFFCTDSSGSRFVPTSSVPLPCAVPVKGRAIDARHGRVLLNTSGAWSWDFIFNCSGDDLVVWDPITGEHRRLPKLPDHMYPHPYPICCSWTAAVLCAAAGGRCDHLDCHRGPFLVVFVCNSSRETFACVYSSEAGAWSGPASARLRRASVHPATRSAVVGNALFFMSDSGRRKRILKYVLGTQEVSTIYVPRIPYRHIALMTMADGGLGFAAVHEYKLYLWSRVSDTKGYARWAQCRAIDLQPWAQCRAIDLQPSLLPISTLPASLDIIYVEDSVVAIFMGSYDAFFFTMDLKTLQIKISEDHIGWPVIPYMSFYTPELGAASTGEEPREGSLTA